jgi:outer membrane protein assembly factor BamB
MGFQSVIARNPSTGAVVRQFPTLGELEAISSSGVLYLINPFQGVTALNLMGQTLWHFQRSAVMFDTLTVDAAGKALFSDEFGNFIALSNQGAFLWELPLATVAFPSHNPPVVLADGGMLVQQRYSLLLVNVPEPHGAVIGFIAVLGTTVRARRLARRSRSA